MSENKPLQIPLWLHILQWSLLLLMIAFRFAEPVGDGDLFWQMAYGKYMLDQHTLIPDHTIYSWTPGDNPYIYCSWFSEIALYLLHQIGGLPLLFAFRYGVVIGSAALAYTYARHLGWQRRPELLWLLTWLTLGTYVGSILKPELFSLGFMSLFAFNLYSFRLAARRGLPYRRYLVTMVLTMLVWANSHGVFFFGLIALGAFTLGECLNWLASPGLALPRSARLPFLGSVGSCGLAAFCTPYHYHFVVQLFEEAFGVVLSKQSAGDKAAYSSLAAHLPVWRALSFHFQEYLALGIVIALVLCYTLLRRGPERGRFDFSYLTVNVLLGYFFTVYLRSTFYWPIFFVYSSLFLVAILQESNPNAEAAEGTSSGWGDLVMVGSVLLVVHGLFDPMGLSFGSQFLKMPVAQAVQALYLLGVAVLALVVFCYAALRQMQGGSPRLLLQGRYWLFGVALIAQGFLCGRSIYESWNFPYAASWCGFGITYWNPVDEVEFLQKYHPDLKAILNDYDSGGYLIWKLFPQTKVMIDPRSFPYRKFWADYIAYERGQIGLEFLDRFKTELPKVSLVSLKNQALWRTYLKANDRWVPGWVGTAYVVFVPRGHQYPPDAAQFRPGRFETLRNAQKALHVFQFCIEANLYDTAWEALAVMQRKFNSTPDQKATVANLEAYKRCVEAIKANKLEEAIAAQEECRKYGVFFNPNLLLELYKIQLSRFRKAGTPETDPAFREVLMKAQGLLQSMRPQ